MQISRKRDIFERKWAAFTDKIDEERFESSDKIASKLQEFLLLAVELDDPIRLQQISDFSKKFSVARKKVNERACIAYAQMLLGPDVGLSVAEVLEVTRAANKCFKASKNRHNCSDSADSSASDSDSAREGSAKEIKKQIRKITDGFVFGIPKQTTSFQGCVLLLLGRGSHIAQLPKAPQKQESSSLFFGEMPQL